MTDGRFIRRCCIVSQIAERLEQRIDTGAVAFPAADRSRVHGLSHLGVARRLHRSLRLVESEAAIVPWQSEKIHHAAGDAFQIRDGILVVDLELAAAMRRRANGS